MPYCYLLRCADGSYYCGSTRHELHVRIEQHGSGRGSEYTATRLPVEVVWAAEFDRIDDAYLLEKRIHGWGRAKREALIAGEFERLPGLSKKELFARQQLTE